MELIFERKGDIKGISNLCAIATEKEGYRIFLYWLLINIIKIPKLC
jgi:hypothetical protein